MKSLKEMIAEARQIIPEEGPEQLEKRLRSDTPPVVIDVRDPDEYREGHIEAASNISRGFLEFRIGATVTDPTTPVVLYCQTGLRSMLAAKALHELGYSKVINLQGGYQKWAQSGLPTVRDIPLSSDQIQRYSRHFLLTQVGEKGQRRLLRSKALLIGAGGLGSPTALYLAAAGVGTIGLVDFDVVDRSNLQRQVLHGTGAVGVSKLESARARLQDLNPNIRLELFEARLTSANGLEVLRGWDVVLDGSDNFPTRYLVNDACVLLGIPNVYGAVLRFDGQVSVFDAKRGPCYRCLYREPPPPELVPSCAEGGVMGVVPGVVGSLQALEAIKLVIGSGTSLVGRLLLFDGLKLQFREIALTKDPDCAVCGPHPTVKRLIDYEGFCGIGEGGGKADGEEIDAVALRAECERAPDLVLLDVREPFEWDIARIEGARLIPLGELPGRLRELDGHADIVTYCHHGTRSRRATEILRAAGFSKVRSLTGGIDAWSNEVDTTVPRY